MRFVDQNPVVCGILARYVMRNYVRNVQYAVINAKDSIASGVNAEMSIRMRQLTTIFVTIASEPFKIT